MNDEQNDDARLFIDADGCLFIDGIIGRVTIPPSPIEELFARIEALEARITQLEDALITALKTPPGVP